MKKIQINYIIKFKNYKNIQKIIILIIRIKNNKQKNNSITDLDFKNLKNENYFIRMENISKNNLINIHIINSVYPHTLKFAKH